jgi:hypothetical protein
MIQSGPALVDSLLPADLVTPVQMLAAIFAAQNQMTAAFPSIFNSRLGINLEKFLKVF